MTRRDHILGLTREGSEWASPPAGCSATCAFRVEPGPFLDAQRNGQELRAISLVTRSPAWQCWPTLISTRC